MSVDFLSSFLGLCLVHEGVEGIVEGIHEVGVMDGGLGACRNLCHYNSNIIYYHVSSCIISVGWAIQCLKMIVEDCRVFKTCEFGGEAFVSVSEDVHILVVVPRPVG